MQNIQEEIEHIKRYFTITSKIKPNFIKKQEKIAKLSILLSNELNCMTDDLIIACYYANIGLLSMSEIINQNKLIHKKSSEFDIIKRHTQISADMLYELGFKKAGDIVLYHHETPTGSGYYKEQINTKEPYCIYIAESFLGMILPKHYPVPLMSKQRAIQTLSNEFIKSNFLSNQEQKNIITILNQFKVEI